MLKRFFTRRRTLAFLAMTLFAGGGGAGLSLFLPGIAPTGEADGEPGVETASRWSDYLAGAVLRFNNEEKTDEESDAEGATEATATPPPTTLPPPPPPQGFNDFVPAPPDGRTGEFQLTPSPPSLGSDTVRPHGDAPGVGDEGEAPGVRSGPNLAGPSASEREPSPAELPPGDDLTKNGLRGDDASHVPPPQDFARPPAGSDTVTAADEPPANLSRLPREATAEELYRSEPPDDPYAGPSGDAPRADYGVPNPYAPPAAASPSSNAYSAPSGPAKRLDLNDATAEPIPGSSGPSAGVPGPRSLEGIQAADVKLVKNAPAEIQVGIPATFELKALNASEKEIRNVVVRDQVPKGTRFLEGSPQPSVLADGTLVWNVGSLKPHEELTITMRVMPEQEGEIGSVATVLFSAEASARTVCTRPRLAIRVTGPANVLIGQPAECQLVVSNEGTGAATGVAIEADLPPQFKHPAGAQLEYEIGALQPGESKTLPLTLTAAEAGATSCAIRVRAEGVPGAEDSLETEVVAPQLAVAAKGPTRRYLQRQAVYEVFVQNPGTAPAQEVDLAAYLPRGMQFVGANNQGQYDPERHAVFWSLVELPRQERGSVQVAVMPVEEGEQKLRVEANAALELQAESELGIVVEAQVELEFEIASLNDPIEIGADAVYEVRVANLGAKAATGVVVAATFPPGLQPLPDQAGSYRVEGQRVVFTSVSRLEPGDEILLKAAARGAAEGDHRVAVEVASAEIATPILKEARTRVYRDQ